MHPSPRRWRLPAATAAVACVALVPAPAHASTNSCRAAATASGNQVRTATPRAIVFHSRRLRQDVACTYHDKRLVRLGNVVCCELTRYALGGRYLAYAYRTSEVDNEVDEMGVFDLSTGRRLTYRKQSAASTVDTEGYVRSFFVTSRGVLVWSQAFQENEVHTDPHEIAVRTIAAGGATKDLDDGNALDALSLAVGANGKRAYWTTDDGTVRSAPLG